MGLSQIDMVSQVTNEMVGQVTDPRAVVPGTLQVCGPLVLETGDPSGDANIFAVVRQGNLVAAGSDTISGPRWGIHVHEPRRQAFETGSAVASVTITLRKETGLETLSWVQSVDIKTPRQAPPATDPPPDLAALASEVVSAQDGQLNDQSIASSLAIRAEAGPTHTWRHQLEKLRTPGSG